MTTAEIIAAIKVLHDLSQKLLEGITNQNQLAICREIQNKGKKGQSNILTCIALTKFFGHHGSLVA